MGKVTTIYLTDEEVIELKKFCEDNNCTQYSAIKTALREILSKRAAIVDKKTVEGELDDF